MADRDYGATPQDAGDVERIRQAARYVLENSRRGNASLNDEQFDADTDRLLIAYRDIITKAVASGCLAMPAPATVETQRVTVTDYNAVFDPADEAGRDAYTEGFRQGWVFAQTPDGEDYNEHLENYGRNVDMEPQEAWDSYRDEWFKHLPLAALPTIGALQTPPAVESAGEYARGVEVARNKVCARCDGLGRLTMHSVPCIACNGTGENP